LADGLRLTAIDESNREIHPRLTAEDKCLFLFEYTSGKRWDFSATNGLVSTLKRKPGQKGQFYKNQAIQHCGALFRATLNHDWLKQGTLVPVPPSKALNDPAYDNRMERICRAIAPGLDIRLLVRQFVSTTAAHELGGAPRPTVEDLVANYRIDEAITQPPPKAIAIFDDVLTAGTHFKAMQTVLAERFPQVPIFGIFIARRVFPEVPIDDWF
jgi:hypothetical protein